MPEKIGSRWCFFKELSAILLIEKRYGRFFCFSQFLCKISVVENDKKEEPMLNKPREGELFKVVRHEGKDFFIYYGYYDDMERKSKYNDPLPIYPDFQKTPEYTDDGYPFVTGIQDVCEHYEGRCPEDGCHSCKYYCGGDDLIGVCKNIKTNRNK